MWIWHAEESKITNSHCRLVKATPRREPSAIFHNPLMRSLTYKVISSGRRFWQKKEPCWGEALTFLLLKLTLYNTSLEVSSPSPNRGSRFDNALTRLHKAFLLWKSSSGQKEKGLHVIYAHTPRSSTSSAEVTRKRKGLCHLLMGICFSPSKKVRAAEGTQMSSFLWKEGILLESLLFILLPNSSIL